MIQFKNDGSKETPSWGAMLRISHRKNGMSSLFIRYMSHYSYSQLVLRWSPCLSNGLEWLLCLHFSFFLVYFWFPCVIVCDWEILLHTCDAGVASKDRWWKRKLLVLFTILVCFVALVQCFTGMDVLRWRSFYSTQDHAWKAHYSEIFDHGIREALCCLGRSKYLYFSSSSSSLPSLSGFFLYAVHCYSSFSYPGVMF